MSTTIADSAVKTAKKSQKFQIPEYLREMNIIEKEINHKIIKNMNKRINYTRNPRFKQIQRPILFQDITQKPNLITTVDHQDSIFRANPEVVIFQDCMINQVYEISLTLTNVNQTLQRIQYLPPTLPQFTLTEVIYPGAQCNGLYEDHPLNIDQLGYHKAQKGAIASGMSVIFKIQFHATSFSDFEDELHVITESSILQIPILAKKEPPNINLPEVMDINSCWIGDTSDMVYRVHNKGGEAGFKFFHVNEDQDENQNGQVIALRNFTIWPSEFYIQKGEVIEVFVKFTPAKQGVTKEKIILACDNGTNGTYQLKGIGNMAELNVKTIDGIEVQADAFEGKMQKIFFQPCFPQESVERLVNIKNMTSVKVKYHWSIFKTDGRDLQLDLNREKDYQFRIQPLEGYFQHEQSINFKITFNCQDPIPIYEYASLIIDEIPIESIRNPPESIQKAIEENQQKAKKVLAPEMESPGFFGSNSSKPSITYFDFEMIGLGKYCTVEIDKPFYVFPYEIFMNKVCTYSFQLANQSKCNLKYSTVIKVVSGPYITPIIKEKQGAIKQHQTIDLEVGFSSSEIGQNKQIVVLVNFDLANSVSVQLVANVVGPTIRINEPNLYYGLIKNSSSKSLNLTLENTSEIDAEIALRDINLEIFKKIPTQQMFDAIKAHQERRRQLNSVNSVTFNDFEVLDSSIRSTYELILDQCYLVLPAKSQKMIKIQCSTRDPETVRTFLEVITKHTDVKYLEVFAEIQKTHISLNRFSLNFDCLYANNIYVYEKGKTDQYIELQNLGNLPTPFQWENPDKQDYMGVKLQPVKGVIPPKSVIPIQFTLKPKVGGSFNEIFACDCEGLDYPLGFQINTKILGLTVQYDLVEFIPEKSIRGNNTSASALDVSRGPLLPANKFAAKYMQPKSQKNPENPNDSSIRSGTNTHGDAQKVAKSEQFEKLDFFNCQINQPKSIQILLQNTSGIDTNFRFAMETFEPYYGVADRVNMDASFTSDGKRSIGFGATTEISQQSNNKRLLASKKLHDTQQHASVVLLSDEHEKNQQFTSPQGQELTQTRKVEQDQRIYLSNNKGVAIVCEPNQGILHAYAEVVVTITCFNDICGFFEDNLMCLVKGLEMKRFPTVIDIKGSPLIVSPNQLGVNYKGDFPVFNIGYFMRGTGPITKEFQVMNTGPQQVRIKWKVYNLDNHEEESQQEIAKDEQGIVADIEGEKSVINQLPKKHRDYFNIELAPPPLGTDQIVQMNFLPIQPPEALNGPFQIQPEEEEIDGRKEKSFQITFNSDKNRLFNSVVVAQPIIIEKPDVQIGLLALTLAAQTLLPLLHYDKMKTMEGAHRLKFERWALTKNQGQAKSMCFVNNLKGSLIFNIALDGPFELMETFTNSPAKYELMKTKSLSRISTVETYFNLVPTSNVQIKIGLKGTDIHNYDEWPLTMKNYKFGKLTLNYVNGDFQVVQLEGILLRPTVTLNTTGTEGKEGPDFLDFNVVHIQNFQTICVFLSNDSQVPAQWKLNHVQLPAPVNLGTMTMTQLEKEDLVKTDEATVFQFSQTQGIIYGPSLPVKDMPDTSALPTSITQYDNTEQNLFPQRILINFRPKKNIFYKSKFRITVQQGPSVDFILRGTGTYDQAFQK